MFQCNGLSSASEDEHAVAVAEKAVALADGVGVGGECSFAAFGTFAKEGRDQHEEGRFRQVEVCDETRHDPEPVPRTEEDAGGAGVGFEVGNPGLRSETWGTRCRGGAQGAMLQGAGGGGSGGDDAAAIGEGGGDGGGSGGG